jgi:hypothetical protein
VKKIALQKQNYNMEHKKDIGQLIREKLDVLEQNPSNELWQKIENDLNKKQKRKFLLWLIPLFLFLGTSATLLFHNYKNKHDNSKTFVKENVLKTNNPQNNLIENKKTAMADSSIIIEKKHIEKIEKQTSLNNKTSKVFIDTESDSLKKSSTSSYVFVSKKRKLIQSTKQQDVYEIITTYKHTIKKVTSRKAIKTTFAKVNKTKNDSKKNNIQFRKSGFLNKKELYKKQFLSKNKKQKIKNKKIILPLEKAISANDNSTFDEKTTEKKAAEDKSLEPEKTTKIVEKKEKKTKKPLDSVAPQIKEEEKTWHVYVSPYFAPTILNNFSTGDGVTNTNPVENFKGKTTFNYGLYLRWMANEKIGIRIGLGKSNVSYQSTVSRMANQLIDVSNINLNSSQNQIQTNFTNEQKVVLQQDIKYFEIPLEGYYVFKDNKFGLATAVGISYRFHQNNQVFISSTTRSPLEIGSANNIRDMSTTANVHLYFTYKISKKLNLEVAPALKYQFWGFEKTTNFNPYLLILQAGFSYKLY